MREHTETLPPLRVPPGSLLTLTINGREVQAREGDTILEADKSAKNNIH